MSEAAPMSAARLGGNKEADERGSADERKRARLGGSKEADERGSADERSETRRRNRADKRPQL